jgi:Zn finger protein HypA/HybF involved in hydrogenase expression
MKKKVDEIEENEGPPLCKECGEPMMHEEGKWICPHCSGEIDFMGGEDD